MSDYSKALAEARKLKAIMLKHGVPEVSIELRPGRPNSYGEWYAIYPVAEMSHHTVSRYSPSNLTPVLALCKTGRADLPGPLCNGYGGWDLTYRIITMGYANHPGYGGPTTVPTRSGSGYVIPKDSARRYAWGTEYEGGLSEADWTRSLKNPRNGKTMTFREFMGRANAALNEYLEIVPEGHLEHSTWTSRKIDRLGYTKAEGVAEIKQYAVKPEPKPEPEPRPTRRVKGAQVSLQFSDTPPQMASDVGKVFDRADRKGFTFLGGTEAGKPVLRGLLRDAAKAHGFRIHFEREEWVAIRRDVIKGGWEAGYVPVLESSEGQGRHSDRGICWAGCDTKDMGRITVGASHYLTDGRKPGDPNYALNRRMSAAIGKWAREKGAGTNLVFYTGDQNINDRTDDTFHGQPLTSAQDELRSYDNAGHGPIEVVASYNADGRVSAVAARSLDDDDMALFTDHDFVVAVFEVRVLP